MNPIMINILGKAVRLKVSPDIMALGQYDQGNQLIVLKKGMAYDQAIATLLHEIIEAINIDLDLGLKHEAICGMETGIYQVLKDSGVSLVPLMDLLIRAGEGSEGGPGA